MGKRQQKRKGLTAQLVAGLDDDLIRWLDTLPAGTRQQAIKDTLRYGLQLPVPERHNGSNGSDSDRIRELEAWMQQMADAYNKLVRHVDSLGSLPASAITSPDPAEAAPQMSDDEQQQRARKLKKANW